jgi:hypothetical protein
VELTRFHSHLLKLCERLALYNGMELLVWAGNSPTQLPGALLRANTCTQARCYLWPRPWPSTTTAKKEAHHPTCGGLRVKPCHHVFFLHSTTHHTLATVTDTRHIWVVRHKRKAAVNRRAQPHRCGSTMSGNGLECPLTSPPHSRAVWENLKLPTKLANSGSLTQRWKLGLSPTDCWRATHS